MSTGTISESKNIYSTSNEVPIGTWVNGKTIYRKAMYWGAMPNNTTVTKNHNIANIDYIVQVCGISENNNSTPHNYQNIPTPNPTTAYSCALWANKNQIGMKTADDRSYQTAYVWLEYTKT